MALSHAVGLPAIGHVTSASPSVGWAEASCREESGLLCPAMAKMRNSPRFTGEETEAPSGGGPNLNLPTVWVITSGDTALGDTNELAAAQAQAVWAAGPLIPTPRHPGPGRHGSPGEHFWGRVRLYAPLVSTTMYFLQSSEQRQHTL